MGLSEVKLSGRQRERSTTSFPRWICSCLFGRISPFNRHESVVAEIMATPIVINQNRLIFRRRKRLVNHNGTHFGHKVRWEIHARNSRLLSVFVLMLFTMFFTSFQCYGYFYGEKRYNIHKIEALRQKLKFKHQTNIVKYIDWTINSWKM